MISVNKENISYFQHWKKEKVDFIVYFRKYWTKVDWQLAQLMLYVILNSVHYLPAFPGVFSFAMF